MSPRLMVSSFFTLFILAASSGCRDEFPSEQDFSQFQFPDSGVSYGRHVQALFDARCIRCHNGSDPLTPLDLTSPSYNNLLNYQPRLVISQDPDNSLLFQRLAGTVSPRMPPPPDAAITPNQLAGMRKWIEEGAVNN